MGYKIAVLHQGFVPVYRKEFFQLLNERTSNEYVVFHGDPPQATGHIAASRPLAFPNVFVNNVELRFGGRTLIYQPVLRDVRRGNFDALVIGHEFKFISNLMLIVLAKLVGRPVILWGHGYHRPDAAWLARRSSSALARLCDGYLVYTTSGARCLEKAGVNPDVVTTVYNTIDTRAALAARRQLASADVAELRAELGLDPQSRTILYIGRIYQRKRISDLLAAVRLLNADAKAGPFQLVLIGDGPERAEMERMAADLPNVQFRGELYDEEMIARYMRVAVASVMPGSVGLSINHSFAHGVPVVARKGQLHSPEFEYIRDGVNGLVAEASIESFADAIGQVLRDPALQHRLACGALAAGEGFGLDAMVERFDTGTCKAIEAHARRYARANSSHGSSPT